MRSRSEAKKSKPSAAVRTEPLQYNNPSASVKCSICEVVSVVKDCSANDKGALECPACGAPIDTVAMKPTKTIEEDISFPESETITSERPAARKPVFESKNEIAKQDAMLKNAVLPAHEPPPKAYCAECGAEWGIVSGKLWPNCGHDTAPIGNPNEARHYAPPGGSARATVLGRTLHVTRGKHNFGYPGMNFGGFSIGPFDVSVELGPSVGLVEAASAIRADLKAIADDAFDEELKWYEKKLAQLRKAAEGE